MVAEVGLTLGMLTISDLKGEHGSRNQTYISLDLHEVVDFHTKPMG